MADSWVLCIIILQTLLATGASAALVLNEVTRRDIGDTFTLIGTAAEVELCAEQCAEHGAGSRSRESAEAEGCACACPQRAPLFREDRELCVDDLPECSLATFGSGSSAHRIPFVYLPLKGQIIHPSREITFQGVKTPICAVSGAQYLTTKGFVDLRNSLDSDVPFTLFRDEGRTFLQWGGEDDLRKQMSGRMIVVRLLCRDVNETPSPLDLRGVFTPCVAFRLQGSPIRHYNNVTEVSFASNAHTFEMASHSGLSTGEYVAIGISSLLLGLIYVASVFLYLHIKKRRKLVSDGKSNKKLRNVKKFDGSSITERDIVRIHNERLQNVAQLDGDKGVVKKNPLLAMGRHFHQDNKILTSDSGSNVSDSEDITESVHRCEDSRFKAQTSVVVHSVHKNLRIRDEVLAEAAYRDESGIERLPDEHVSIVETTDDREIARPVGTTRRKLYFNPAYFEPHLMAEPPPAALEFLVKIREVIAIAKHKMAAKRFQPVLNEIPEEDSYGSHANSIDMYHGMGSQRSESIVSLKRENSRKKSCVGCPGCKSGGNQDLQNFMKYEYPACANCQLNRGEKQNSIRQWLENIPTVKLQPYNEVSNRTANSSQSLHSMSKVKRQNSFTVSGQLMRMSDDFEFPKKTKTLSVRSEPGIRSYNFPLPDFQHNDCQSHFVYHGQTISRANDIRPVGFNSQRHSKPPHRNSLGNVRKNKFITQKNTLPDMVSEAIALENYSKTYTQNNSDDKFLIETGVDNEPSPENNFDIPSGDCDTDSLERAERKKSMSTPATSEVTSSQASPSLSTALPLEEELTMRNAIYKTMSSSNSNTPSPLGNSNQNHYETIGKSQGRNQKFKNRNTLSNDYSLVSEVYVNNSYECDSPPTSPSTSDKSTESRNFNNPNATILENHGCLTIEVKDSPENYIQIHESDGFDPDTLDRKQIKQKEHMENSTFSRKGLLNGLSKSPSSNSRKELQSSDTYKKSVRDNLKNFNSKSLNGRRTLRDKRNSIVTDSRDESISTTASETTKSEVWKEIPPDWYTEEGRILTLEVRHSKRQRQCTPDTIKQIKTLARPDVLPPLPPVNQPIYEHPPFPPRKVESEIKPSDLNPKNEIGRSSSPRSIKIQNKTESARKPRKSTVGNLIGQSRASVRSLPSDNDIFYYPEGGCKTDESSRMSSRRRALKASSTSSINTNTFVKSKEDGHKFRYRRKKASSVEDSGYLSSDSASSRRFPRKIVVAKIVSCSESDDSEHEAQSESGAESVETHSVFFGSFRNTPGNPTFSNRSRNFDLTGKKHAQQF